MTTSALPLDAVSRPPGAISAAPAGASYAHVIDRSDLLSADVSPKFHKSRLDHLCYVLRHTAQHTGEINAILRRAGEDVGKWL